ncbi:hypothetical protein ABZW10_18575 [Kitasatospora sp. NPDC004723]|uniref:hypothetical protein n=1 Tax=Kitasatospora sp. NPDC004723 TaxID=3154288 RepID=UPI0033BE1812
MSSPPVIRTPRLPLFPPARSADRAPAPPAVRLPRLLLRGATTASAVLVLAETVLAAGFLNGHYEALRVHALAAMALGGVLLLQLAAAVPVRRVTGPAGERGPWWPLVVTALLLLAAGVQTGTGYERAVGVHVTLGVLLVSAHLFCLVGAWRLPLTLPAPASTSAPTSSPAVEDGTGRLPRPSGTGSGSGSGTGSGSGAGTGPVEVAP